MNKCASCPVADPDLPCRAGVFCGWMAVAVPDPVHVRHINAVALKDADRPLPPQAAVPCSEGHEATVIHATPAVPLAGDMVASLTAAVGVDRLAKWVAKKATGVPNCGCESRRIALNELDAKARKLVARLARRGAKP